MSAPPSPLTDVNPTVPFADEVRTLAVANARLGSAPSAIVFYGSSSIRLWETLAADFAGREVLNRGFGGATLEDCAREFERLVAPLRPRSVVLYAGDNDLDHGASPEHVLWVYESLLVSLRAHLGGIPVLTLSIKPSPIRFWNSYQIRRTNHLMRETSERRGVLFVDVYEPMLHEHGGPRRELFGEDGLHLSAAGYALWAEKLRLVLPGGAGT